MVDTVDFTEAADRGRGAAFDLSVATTTLRGMGEGAPLEDPAVEDATDVADVADVRRCRTSIGTVRPLGPLMLPRPLLLDTLDIADVVRPLGDGAEGAVSNVVDASLLADTRECGRDKGDGVAAVVLGFGDGGTRAFRRVDVVEVVERTELAVDRTEATDGARDFGLPVGGLRVDVDAPFCRALSTRARGGVGLCPGKEDVEEEGEGELGSAEGLIRACAVPVVRIEETEEAIELRLDASDSSRCTSPGFCTVVRAAFRFKTLARNDVMLPVSAS